MDRPKITIGLPVYNGAKFIRYAITSICQQTFQDFELIITDDGSTDNTLEILSRIKDNRIRIISDGKNKGISHRLNQQISLAKGIYFCRMDVDDIMMPNRLKEQVDFLESNPLIDVVGSSAIIIDDKNNIIGSRGIKSDNDTSSTEYFIHPTVMGKLSFFNEFRYDESFNGAEDLDLWIRGRRASNYFQINTPLLFYRDPQKYKLKTYIKRLKTVGKIFHKHYNCRVINRHTYYRFKISKPIQIFIASISRVLGIESAIVKRRNQHISTTATIKYSFILNEIINNGIENPEAPNSTFTSQTP